MESLDLLTAFDAVQLDCINIHIKFDKAVAFILYMTLRKDERPSSTVNTCACSTSVQYCLKIQTWKCIRGTTYLSLSLSLCIYIYKYMYYIYIYYINYICIYICIYKYHGTFFTAKLMVPDRISQKSIKKFNNLKTLLLSIHFLYFIYIFYSFRRYLFHGTTL